MRTIDACAGHGRIGPYLAGGVRATAPKLREAERSDTTMRGLRGRDAPFEDPLLAARHHEHGGFKGAGRPLRATPRARGFKGAGRPLAIHAIHALHAIYAIYAIYAIHAIHALPRLVVQGGRPVPLTPSPILVVSRSKQGIPEGGVPPP